MTAYYEPTHLARTLLDVERQITEERQRREQAEAELALALGAISAQDERETQAGARCDVPYEQYGCDWPDAMADALLEARSEMRLARAERDDIIAKLRDPYVTHTLILCGDIVLSDIYTDQYQRNRDAECAALRRAGEGA